jgi:hypothetical protein
MRASVVSCDVRRKEPAKKEQMFCLWWSCFDADVSIRASDGNDHVHQLPGFRQLPEQSHNTTIASTHPWESSLKLAEQLLASRYFHPLGHHDHLNMHFSCCTPLQGSILYDDLTVRCVTTEKLFLSRLHRG